MPKQAQKKSEIKEDLNQVPALWQVPNDLSLRNEDLYSQTDFDKNYIYFHIMGHEEAHSVRRRKILEKHPEIQLLYGHDPATMWVGFACLLFQFTCANFFSQYNWLIFILSAYFLGASCSHTVYVLIHDITHYTCFESPVANKIFAILVNLVNAVPSAITFGRYFLAFFSLFSRYHADHHYFMNIVHLDPDIPSLWEVEFVQTPFRKFVFILLYPLFYSVRPLIKNPKVPNTLEIFNILAVLLSDYLVYLKMGPWALVWMLMSVYIGLSLHPLAGNLIAEHYEFLNRLETYDYLGLANYFNLNIGYHIEHHDFPQIPWTRLPIVRKMAPEFYEQYPYHTSYTKVFIQRFIFDEYMGPWSRIIRKVAIEKKLN